MASRVVHFEIHATEPEPLIAFYTDLFGWSFERWVAPGAEWPYWMVATGPADEPGINGGLLPRRGTRAEDGQGVNAYVCTVGVASVNDTLARAIELGGTEAAPVVPIPVDGVAGLREGPRRQPVRADAARRERPIGSFRPLP